MFWGLILKANKKYSQTVQKAFHLSQAALDLSKSSDDDVQVMLTSEDNTYLLCTLGKKTPQVALDLNFDEGDHISLSTKGEGIVHLTGYLVPSEEDIFGGEDDDEELEEEEEVEAEVPQQKAKGGKQERVAKKVALKVNAKEVQQQPDDEDDEMDETFELPKGAAKKKAGEDDEADSDDDSDEDEDEDDDDELDESKNGAGEGESDSDDDDEDDDEEEDDSDDDDEDEDDSEDEQPKAKVPKMDKKQQQQGKQNGLENGKASSKELKKDEKAAAAAQKGEPKTKTLQGGLVVEEIKVGSGAEAKPGKKIAVYYEGRLKKNNKVFDSTAKGPGFKFALGRGEVIKGWDLGVAGMKVGGKRRLTVPHQLAYGTRGSPPVIPPNSTLVFDVELKNVF
ncbi:46 kDa FK506-binding nuclear protein [Toxorhynchites rutilus septentrionalis]|uniref:46 kDa FK506-binding nuclear protein n=1 Tax=Toxorhynchites rutilus septentrionalis TaxID=329112 RepID=UPI00247A8D2B|nr:46 kDa FK506-binding nuclear protein [Toxorhynchites rutilus septentrionalis]